jgi:hypothetical protein
MNIGYRVQVVLLPNMRDGHAPSELGWQNDDAARSRRKPRRAREARRGPPVSAREQHHNPGHVVAEIVAVR